jgi:hypothetical protein
MIWMLNYNKTLPSQYDPWVTLKVTIRTEHVKHTYDKHLRPQLLETVVRFVCLTVMHNQTKTTIGGPEYAVEDFDYALGDLIQTPRKLLKELSYNNTVCKVMRDYEDSFIDEIFNKPPIKTTQTTYRGRYLHGLGV